MRLGDRWKFTACGAGYRLSLVKTGKTAARNGKARDAKVTLERIRAVMPVFQGEPGGRKRDPSSRRLWTALREIDRYLISQNAWLFNYAERHRAGLRVGTSIMEGTANFLVTAA